MVGETYSLLLTMNSFFLGKMLDWIIDLRDQVRIHSSLTFFSICKKISKRIDAPLSIIVMTG